MALPLNISDIQLFNSLKAKLGEQEAETLVGYVKSYIRSEVGEAVPEIATKEFVEIKINEAVAKMKTGIAEAKFQLSLWAFVFWATQLCAIFAFLKFVR
jgi:hypothetical protein